MVRKGYKKINLWLLYDKIMFLSHQKVRKVANACSYAKERKSLLIKRLFMVTLKSLLLLASMKKSPKSDEWLQNKCSFIRSSHRRCFVKKGVSKKFVKFTGKHLCWSLFLNKVAGLKSATLLKRDPNTGVFLWIL